MPQHWILVFILAFIGIALSEPTEDPDIFYGEIKCPSEAWYSSGTSCYFLLGAGEQLSFFEAEWKCQSLDKRAHLAYFSNNEEFYHIQHIITRQRQLIVSPEAAGTWIGLSKNSDGVWEWGDTYPLTYDLWLSGEPSLDGNCAYTPQYRVGYADSMCEEKRGALCEVAPGTYDFMEIERRYMTNAFIVAVVVSVVVVGGGVIFLAMCLSKYGVKGGKTPKGYKLQKNEEANI